MYVRIYKCLHVLTYMYIYVYSRGASRQTQTHTVCLRAGIIAEPVCVRMYTYIHFVYTNIYKCICTFIYLYIWVFIWKVRSPNPDAHSLLACWNNCIVYMYMYTYSYTCTNTHIYMCIYTFIYMYVWAHIFKALLPNTETHSLLAILKNCSACICTHVYIMFTCTHIHIYMCIYVYIFL